MLITTVTCENKALFESMAPAQWFDLLELPGRFVLGAIDEDDQGQYAAGVLVFEVEEISPEEDAYLIAGTLRWLYVEPQARGRGVGDALKGLGDAAEAASSGGFKSLLSAIGSSGAGIGLIAVLPVATKLIAGFVETLQGGNGKLSEMGGAINDLSGKLQNFGLLTSAQVDEIRKIVDSCEDAQMSSAEMADVVMEKFAEWGISTQNVNSVLQSNDYWTTKTKESVDLLAQSAQILGEGMSASAESINLSSVTVKEGLGGIRDSLYELSLSSDEFGGTYQGVLMSLDGTISSATTAQEAMDMVIGQLEAAGVPADEFIAKMQEEFPEAMQATKKSVETNITGARQTFEKEAGSMKETAEADLESIESDAENYFGGVNDTTVTNWGDSAEEVKLSKDVPGRCNEHYIISIKDQNIAVFTVDSEGKEILKEVTDIPIQYLPKEDVELLEKGIKAYGENELSKILEDYE